MLCCGVLRDPADPPDPAERCDPRDPVEGARGGHGPVVAPASRPGGGSRGSSYRGSERPSRPDGDTGGGARG